MTSTYAWNAFDQLIQIFTNPTNPSELQFAEDTLQVLEDTNGDRIAAAKLMEKKGYVADVNMSVFNVNDGELED